MQLKSGLPYWFVKSGLLFSYQKLTESITTDVAIIGAGISGALTSFDLKKNNVDCVILDARTVALGSTCASTSLLLYEIDTSLVKLIDRIGEKNALRTYELGVHAVHRLKEIAGEIKSSGVEMKNSIYLANSRRDEAFLCKEYKLRKEFGFKVEWLSAKKLKEVYGILAPCGILSSDAAETDSYLFTHQLLQFGLKRGLKVFDRTKVTRIRYRKNNVVLETEDGFTVTANKIIFATGYETVSRIENKLVKLYTTFVTTSEQIYSAGELLKEDCVIWNTSDPYLYIRSTPDNRIMIGGRDEPFYDLKRAEKIIEKKSKQLIGDFKKIFPNSDFKSEFNWSGVFAETKDGLPYIGSQRKYPNSYFALGFGGNGITFSAIAAEIITDLILGRENSDAELFSFHRKN